MIIYTIYKFTNIVDGKCYIGKTNNFKRRVKDHFKGSENTQNFLLHRAIKKYGVESFIVEIIFQSNSKLISEKQFTNIFEPMLIKEHNSHKSQNGYNMTRGGEGFDSETAKEINEKKLKSGTHHLTKREDGTSHTSDRVKNGTHNFLKRPDGTSQSKDKVIAGTHHFLKNKNFINCINLLGEYNKIHTKKFYSQSGPKEIWEWVAISSKEGKKRAGKDAENHHINGKVSCINFKGEFERISKEQYHSQTGPMEDWEWVQISSKESRKRKSSVIKI